MNKLTSLLILMLSSSQVFAINTVPEPESLALVGIGVAAILLARVKKQ